MKIGAKPADDLQLDLLVDDELPETERRDVLQSLDATPVLWRDLAIRFMQRQVERKVIRQIIQQQNIAPPAACKPFIFGKSVSYLRIAAAFILTAGLAADFALLYSSGVDRQGTSGPNDSSSIETASIIVPAAPLTGSTGPDQSVTLPVKLSPLSDPSRFNFGTVMPQPTGNASSRHVVIMPNGQNGAVVFPVTTVKDEVVY